MKPKATHSLSLAPPLDCQDVSKYPARDLTLWQDEHPEHLSAHGRWICALAFVVAVIFGLALGFVWAITGGGR